MPDLAQFNWRIGRSDYARVRFDESKSHTGSRSLLIEFLNRDTTRLDNEIKHLIALRAGVNYRLEFFFAAENLQTSEAPRVVVSDDAGKSIAASEPLSRAESGDWKRVSFNFTAPQSKAAGEGVALFVSVKRKPKYSYDEPTRGRIWLDDFSVREVNGK